MSQQNAALEGAPRASRAGRRGDGLGDRADRRDQRPRSAVGDLRAHLPSYGRQTGLGLLFFDVQSDTPGTLYRLTHAGAHAPIPGELDIIDAIPGDAGYTDFWRVVWVAVPASFVPGSITSAAQIRGLPVAPSASIIDCPVVPRGSTARQAHGVAPVTSTELAYRGERVTCLHFAPDLTIDGERVPTSPIYVTFASEAGPSSGFRTEPATPQTHNVVMSLPGDLEYSPLWAVHVYDPSAFERVRDASSATTAPVVAQGPLVNCPIVWIGPAGSP